jgi:peptide deformylase
MAVRDILKMGDPRLLRIAQPVKAFNTPELQALLKDLDDTMLAANGAGLAAPQIGVDLQVVVFGSGEANPRYPDAPVVPYTVLINPVLTPLGAEEEEGWEGACLCRACAVWCHALNACATKALMRRASRLTARWRAFMRGWCNTNATT